MTPRYVITLEPDGNRWRATVDGIPGCTVTRSSRRLALEHIGTALEMHLQAHELSGGWPLCTCGDPACAGGAES